MGFLLSCKTEAGLGSGLWVLLQLLQPKLPGSEPASLPACLLQMPVCKRSAIGAHANVAQDFESSDPVLQCSR